MQDAPSQRAAHRGGITWQPMAWIGAQLGGTVWLLFLTLVLMGSHPEVAAVAAMCFVVANLLGWRLWRHRARRTARDGILILLGIEFAAGLTSLIAADVSGALHGVVKPGVHSTFVAGSLLYLHLLVFPLVGLMLWRLDRSMRDVPKFRMGRGQEPRDRRPPG
jgi:hypothetical protein